MELSLPAQSGGADREGVAEAERLLDGDAPLGRATAERAVDAVNVRRSRMSAYLAFLRVHHSDSTQGSCLRIVVGRVCFYARVCNRWRKMPETGQTGASSLPGVDYDLAMQVNELFDAIRNGDAESIASLIDAEPSLIASRQNGISPILFAVYNGHAELAQLLIGRGTEQGARPSFVEACALGDKESVLQMLDTDRALLDSFSDDGFPAVGLAVFFRHPDVARLLIERGADVNATAQNAFRVAPVHAAAATRDASIMQLLIDHGADVNARQQMGYTALHTAAQLGDRAMLDLLLAAGADPRAAGDDGKTPADLAAAHGHTAIAERLS